VRSLSGAYRWVTCPLILERLRRDLARCGATASLAAVTVPPAGDSSGVLGPGKVNDKLLPRGTRADTRRPAPKAVLDAIGHSFATPRPATGSPASLRSSTTTTSPVLPLRRADPGA